MRPLRSSTVCLRAIAPRPAVPLCRAPACLRQFAAIAAAVVPPQGPAVGFSSTSLPALSTQIRSLLSQTNPAEQSILGALRALRLLASSSSPAAPYPPSSSPAATLLPPSASPTPDDATSTQISALADEILTSPSTFLTPPILHSLILLSSTLHTASLLPPALHLYAHKPNNRAPPSSPKNAIPPELASAALGLALKHGSLYTALDIVDLSFATPAFRRRKALAKALPFALTAFVATPAALWGLADQLAGWQDTVDHALAQKYMFGGFCAYFGVVSTIGLVALATANDQMVRVTWVKGTPLRERWTREEERAALDKVAMRWGYAEQRKWGTEEGEEWEVLREVAGRKGMVVDATELLEGME